MQDQIRVFLLDDHEVVRRGVRELVELQDDMTVVGEAGTAEEALVRVPAARPDVAVLDLRLPDGSGVEVCRDIRAAQPEVQCLVLTSFNDDEALVQATLAGAAAYVLKQIRGNDLLEKIRRVAAGESLMEGARRAKVLEQLRAERELRHDPAWVLTPQEKRILAFLGQGLTNRQIAERMGLAEKTVKNYMSHLLAKLGMTRRTEAAVFAVRRDERARRAAS